MRSAHRQSERVVVISGVWSCGRLICGDFWSEREKGACQRTRRHDSANDIDPPLLEIFIFQRPRDALEARLLDSRLGEFSISRGASHCSKWYFFFQAKIKLCLLYKTWVAIYTFGYFITSSLCPLGRQPDLDTPAKMLLHTNTAQQIVQIPVVATLSLSLD